jgi:DNA-binding beta-propeller fold protein YncE
MKPFVMRALTACAIVAMPAGCSGTNQAVPLANPNSPAAASVPLKARDKTVVLVTDSGTNEVYTYAYPSGTPLKTLTGFNEPQGACSDGAGHFWVANTGDSNVLEISSAGEVLNTLSDKGNYPVGCSYDPTSGDLAVSNLITTGDGPGNVAVFRKASGMPKIVAIPALQRVYFIAYAGSTSTLVVSGEDASYESTVAILSRGVSRVLILEGTTIAFPGGLAWSTKLHLMNVVDQETGVVYRFKLTGRIVGSTKLQGAGDIVDDFAIFGGTLLTVGAGTGANSDFEVFAYPSGTLKKTIPEKGFSEPIGLAVSSAVTE